MLQFYERRVELISRELNTIENDIKNRFLPTYSRSVPGLKLSIERFDGIYKSLSREPADSKLAVIKLLQPLVNKIKFLIHEMIQTETDSEIVDTLRQCNQKFVQSCSLIGTNFTPNSPITNDTNNPYIVPELFS